MKIIKAGVLPSEKEYELTCKKCECIFEFKEKEATQHSDPREGAYKTIDCPTCKTTIYF